jgi:hypothetical protein
MERHLFLKNRGKKLLQPNRYLILSTYLPLFPPICEKRMEELTNHENQAILYDALQNYYLMKMKDVDTIPLEMPLEALRSYALTIKEAAINPGKSEKNFE